MPPAGAPLAAEYHHPYDSARADDPVVVGLVDRVLAVRDPEAFGELYDRFVDRVYRYLYFRTGNRAEAEDLTEEVFLRAWQAIDHFRWQGRPFLAWLYRLAHNVLVDHVRRRRPTSSLDARDGPTEPACHRSATELDRRLDADVLARAVALLTPDQQQVIVLRFVDDFDTDEIARALDKREDTIRGLQMRALRSLRRLLRERAGPDGKESE